MIRVAVNGYGGEGHRIADAVALQPDMRLMGVVKVTPDYRSKLALSKNYRLYIPEEKARKAHEQMGFQVAGTLDDLVKEVDVVIDATSEGVGETYKSLYANNGKKAIFQGGEKPTVADVSFVAQCNFEEARGKRFVRVVSCNTTALCRVLGSLDKALGVRRARVVIARRAADPHDSKRGPIDGVSLDPAKIPSHHGSDVRTVLSNLDIVTMALKVPTTHMHVHTLIISTKRTTNEEEVRNVLEETQRLALVESSLGFNSSSAVMDYAREAERPRGDLYEAVVWSDSLKVVEDEVYMFMGVDQQAIVVPENVDAVRAVAANVSARESIELTNKTLKIKDTGVN